METAKVDIRKLQLLNDRINQTIEALNQVRLSVHGIGHSAGYAQHMNPFGMGTMQSLGYGTTPGFPSPYSVQSQFPGSVWGAMGGGLGHTGGWQSPSTMGWTGVSQSGFVPGFGTTGFGSSVEGYQIEPPQVLARVAHTFPYAFLPQTPYGQIV